MTTGAVGLVGLVLASRWITVDVSLLVIVPIVTAFTMRRMLHLTLSASGVTFVRRTADWHTVELREGRFGTSLRSVKGTPMRAARVNVFLPIYEKAWRHGLIADDLRRWAPALLPQPPAA